MRVSRHYTSDSVSPFSAVNSKYITIEICHEDPARRLCIPDFEVPTHWSQQAAEHLAHHYIRRFGVPSITKRVEEEGVPEWLQRSVADEEALADVSEKVRYGSEASYRQVIHRLVGAWCYWGWTHGYFDTEQDAKHYYDEMCYLIVMQHAMPASPQWSNTGLHWAYGLKGDSQGCVYVDAESGELKASPNAYERPQHHHCFIQGVKDDLSGEGGIADLWQREMRVFKYGSGSGCNMSSIRGSFETLSSGQRSAGLVSFMEIGEKAAEALSGNLPRFNHASKLTLIDADHPDVLTALQWRLSQHRSEIARDIGISKMRQFHQKIQHAIREFNGLDVHRFDPTINHFLMEVIQEAKQRHISEPYIMQYIDEFRVAGETFSHLSEWYSDRPSQHNNTNQIGLRLSDDFMRAACHERTWSLKSRVERKEMAQVNAHEMLDRLAHFNWSTRDGMVQFSDNVQFWNTARAQSEIVASSPGGEFLFINDSACDVAVINLGNYVTEEGQFDVVGFEHTTRMQTIMCDISITMAQFPSPDVAYNSYRYRPIGLSFCNLAVMLMQMGYAYDSDESRAIASAVSALMTGKGYVVSAEIARELGGFEAFQDMRDGMMQVMWQHHEAAFGRTQHLGSADVKPMVVDHSVLPHSDLSDAIQKVWDLAMIHGDEFGYSNAQISLVAASPNIVILLDALAPGISPVHSIHSNREKQLWCHAMRKGLEHLGYQPTQIDEMCHYIQGHRSCLMAGAINAESLQEKGFTTHELALVEEALASGQRVEMAFDPLHLGEKFCRDVLGLTDAELYDASFKLLHHLGFEEEEVAQFEDYCNGHDSMDGAPYLRQEDAAIVALSSVSTEQPISVESQIQMAASIQPYISGGIAQPIETPYSASLTQHRHWLVMAWQLGLKHLDLHRAQQNTNLPELSETMHSVSQVVAEESSEPIQKQPQMRKMRVDRSEIITLTPFFQQQKTTIQDDFIAKHRELPNRRYGYLQETHIAGVSVTHRIEEYEDGRPAGLFVDIPDIDANMQQLLQQTMQIFSVALQHGVPVEAFKRAMSDAIYHPHGVVIGHETVTQANSILHYLIQDLQHQQEQKAAVKELASVKKTRDQIILSQETELAE